MSTAALALAFFCWTTLTTRPGCLVWCSRISSLVCSRHGMPSGPRWRGGIRHQVRCSPEVCWSERYMLLWGWLIATWMITHGCRKFKFFVAIWVCIYQCNYQVQIPHRNQPLLISHIKPMYRHKLTKTHPTSGQELQGHGDSLDVLFNFVGFI